jgi:hypothetical protein
MERLVESSTVSPSFKHRSTFRYVPKLSLASSATLTTFSVAAVFLCSSLTDGYDYHEFESQSYGTLWHFRSAIALLYFITVAMAR